MTYFFDGEGGDNAGAPVPGDDTTAAPEAPTQEGEGGGMMPGADAPEGTPAE